MEEPNDLNGPLYLGWYEELNEGVEEQHVGGEDGCEEVTDWEDHSDSDLGSIVGSDPEYQEVVGGLRQKKKKLMKEYSEVKKAINELKKGGKNTKGNSEGNGKRAKHGARKSKLKGKACEAEYDDVGDGEGDGFVGYYGWYDDVFDDEDDGLAGDEGAGTSNPTTGANEGGLKGKEKKRKYEAARRAYKSLPVVINAGGAAKYVHSDEPAQCGEEAHFKGHERGGRRGRYESSSSEEDQYVFPSKPPPPVENDTRFLGETDMYYNEEWEIPYFQAGMRFKNGAQFKKAIQKYAVMRVAGIEKIHNEPNRQTWKCFEGCPWRIHASFDSRVNCFRVKKLSWKHNCRQQPLNKHATADYLAELYRKNVVSDPSFTCKEIMVDMFNSKGVAVGFSKCVRAKNQILTVLEGNFIDEYAEILGYAQYIRSLHPNNTVKVVSQRKSRAPGSPSVFLRMYVCLHMLKEGFKLGCRKVLGIDGTWLRGICKGVLLTAVGKDGNGQMYPVAWAVVDSESHETWSWFLDLVKKDLDLGRGENMTILSDKHKGIISARNQHLPNAEHRFCSRHLLGNLRKHFSTLELEDLFWVAAFAYEENKHEKFMTQLRALSRRSADALEAHDPREWARAYQNHHTSCEDVLNNITETFNGWIKEARALPIISMLEKITDQLLDRRCILYNQMLEWQKETDICPYPFSRFKRRVEDAHKCDIHWNGHHSFKVKDNTWEVIHIVDMLEKTCTCGYWQKTGVPCSHLVRVCWLKGWKPEDFISPYLKLEMYKHAYNEPMHCTRSRDMWVNFNGPRLEPPMLKRRPGRPKKNRIPSTGELRRDKGGKKFAYVSKQGLRMRCGGCQGQGHNTRTCPKLRGTSTGTQFQGSRFQAHHNPYDVTEEDYIAFFRQVNDDENISSSQVTEPAVDASCTQPNENTGAGNGIETDFAAGANEDVAAEANEDVAAEATEDGAANLNEPVAANEDDDVQFQGQVTFDRAASQRFRRQLRQQARKEKRNRHNRQNGAR